MAAKLLYVVLDGAPDGFRRDTALSLADKPGLDSLAERGLCGLAYILGQGIAPESDAAVMSLLGYDPERYYTGRGPLEALGAGLGLPEGGVALRANFATVDPGTLRILDRRVGRSLSSGEARRLGGALDGLELSGGLATARFKATIGHRGVLVLEPHGVRLSGAISNTDPAYVRRGKISIAVESFEPYIREAVALEDTREAQLAASLVNEFTRLAVEILDGHEVNVERRSRGLPPANAVLLRDAGDRLPPAEPIRIKFGLRFASIVEMVVERGIARALGIHDIPVEVEGRDRPDLLREEAKLAARALDKFDAVYVHLKGPDEPGHDGDLEAKVRAIEEIDRYFIRSVLDRIPLEDTLVVVTSDHATPWYRKAHSGDPVPLLLSNPKLDRGPGRFTEEACKDGPLGVVEGGYRILPLALDTMKRL
ncbi:MAG: alkaline phosphatase family protein [Desulfurococcales archaeon]|nr:alkaline phosphatase family protein [Desulfurococcales archaeon]MCE4605497.1 alkaline phosphatase family protein [Desulfurococcales archaeon]